MTREVVSVRHDLTVEELTQLFFERGLHGAPVVDDDGELIGFVSMTDLVRRRYEDGETQEVPLRVHTRSGGQYELGPGFHADAAPRALVREVMMPLAISLEACAPITLAAAMMAFEGVHRIPVVSHDGGRIVGILSALDILRWLAARDGFHPPAAAARAAPLAS